MAREEAEVAAGGRACSLTTVKWGTTCGDGAVISDIVMHHHEGSCGMTGDDLDGTRKAGLTGKFLADRAETRRLAGRTGRQQSEGCEEDEDGADSAVEDPTGVVRKLRK